MTDHLEPAPSNGDEEADASSIQRSPSRSREAGPSSSADGPSNTAARPALNLNTNAAAPPGYGLHRSGTTPPEHIVEGASPVATRRRGRTINSRREIRPLSPRSQLLGRNPSNTAAASSQERAMGSIPEGGRASADSGFRPPVRTNTFTSPGMRPRVNTGRPRGQTLTRRPTIALEAVTSGRDQDAASQAMFSVAGAAPVDQVAANQSYVDPGYTQLNPAYEQPVNVRPVWGLAKPLPRVIRPGMVPTRAEVVAAPPVQEPAIVDLEQGRIDPTLNVRKITSQLQNTREQRENDLLTAYIKPTGPPISLLGRPSSSIAPPMSPNPAALREEDDVGLHPLHQLDSVQEEQLEEARPTQQTTPENHWFPNDAASAITEHEEDGDLDGDYLHEDIVPLPAYEAETDEIHNLHTHWSVIRLRFREPLAELLAVTVQLLLGFCSDLAVATSNDKSGNESTTDWAWGLASMVGIYIAGGISGAHLNPAISIMLYVYRGFPLRKIPSYIFAQILGAFIAALIAFGLYRSDIIAFGGADLKNGGTLSSFITFPRYTWIDASTAFFNEFTGTAVLAVAVLALGDDSNAPPGAGMNAFILGLIVTANSMAFGYNTGAALNPSRDLGPRLAVMAVGYGTQVFRNGYWVYGPWAGTITGALFGAFLYDAAIFVGGESPVNYPRKRMVRAGKKWKKRTGLRIRNLKRRIRRREEVDDGFGGGEKKASF